MKVPARISNLAWEWKDDIQMWVLEAPSDCWIRMPPVVAPDIGWVGSITTHTHPDKHPPVEVRAR